MPACSIKRVATRFAGTPLMQLVDAFWLEYPYAVARLQLKRVLYAFWHNAYSHIDTLS